MNRTIVITGASSGIGLAAAEQLAANGDHVVLVGRNPARLAAAVDRVRAAGNGREPGQFRADFESLDQVRDLAAYLIGTYPKIDVLANNAGSMIANYRRTPDGFEATIQGNHLAPFLLTNLLRERLAGARVVNTASGIHRQVRPGANGLTDFTGDPQKYQSSRTYGWSKSANILFTAETARRWPDVTSVSFHPGIVRSNFASDRAAARFFFRYAPFLVTPENAGARLVRLATLPAADLANGAYYEADKANNATRPAAHANDPAAAATLWDASAKAVGL
ncbi:SDR family NAD(P)-dependent oxidoreductase [Dactylosporangium sp. NPDC051485]|uniref:SDR family NAD(P)-dependent oxidoreductase n=1 Tax=Dactylosporangium sp. NPDC051485 TaxID=3154846 RepID=UPI00342E75B3